MAKKKIVVETKYTAKGVDNVKDSYKDIGTEAKNASKQTEKLGKSSNAFGDAMPGKLGAIQSGFMAVKSGIMKGVMAMKTLRGAVMSTGIGVLLVAFLALKQYFTDNEEGASKLKEMTAQLGVIFGNITDILSDLGKKMFSAFSNPKQAIKDLWKALKTNIVNRIKGIGDMFGALGKTIVSAMKLDTAGMKRGVKDLGKATAKTLTGIDDLGSKINATLKKSQELIRKNNEEMAKARQLEKDRLALHRFERTAIVDKAKAERDMMGLRLKARDEENFTTQERLGAMREANKIAEEQLKKDLHVAREKLRFQEVENSFSKSSAENLDAEAKLKADIFRIEKANF